MLSPVTLQMYEFSYRDATGRQVWQTAKGDTKADAKAERTELLARMHRGERVERTTLTVSEVAQLWLERASGPQGQWADSTRERYDRIVRLHIDASADASTGPTGSCKLRDPSMDRRGLVAGERARALTDHGQRRPDHAQPGLPLRCPAGLAGREPLRQARTGREARLDAAEKVAILEG